ncbi:MAG: hypothetical protein II887_06485 [Bacteroidales bacterium]|nr:hypothetical protein [Bacteroidales bacterium]
MSAIGYGRIITRIVIILLSALLSSWLSKLLSKEEAFTKKKIEKHSRSNLKETVLARKQLKNNRISLTIIIYSVVIAICVIGVIVVLGYLQGDWADSALLSLVTIIFVMFVNMTRSINKNRGNISTVVSKELLSSNRHFSLYLRAFRSDQDASNFSEKDFARLVAKVGFPKLYAVGLPNEVDAPYGATRIYISESTWKQEVEELILKASEIFLRVCDTEPCKWELGKSLSFKEKLSLIVDNISEYDAVRAEFPDLPQLQAFDGCFYILRYKEAADTWKIQKYKLSPKGYVDVKSLFMEQNG